MPNPKAGLLIVDDDPAIRLSMSLLLIEVGYRVRSAPEGFAALREIRKEMPDILLTDLNMPGMSGFELLTIVWRRHPSIYKIAMSGAFCGNEVPSGVAADAFYQKGSSVGALLMIIQFLPEKEYRSSPLCSAAVHQRIQRNQLDSSPDGFAVIACPECLRSFSHCLRGTSGFMCQTDCIHCGNSIEYTIVDHPGSMDPHAIQVKSDAALLTRSAPSLRA